MFRPRLVNTINWRLQDALTTQKHLKVFYKQKIMLNQIKYQLKINSSVRELLSRSSQGHWDGRCFLQAAVVRLLSRLLFWDLLGKRVFAWVPRPQKYQHWKDVKYHLSWALLFQMGKLRSTEKHHPARIQAPHSKEPPVIDREPHLADF